MFSDGTSAVGSTWTGCPARCWPGTCWPAWPSWSTRTARSTRPARSGITSQSVRHMTRALAARGFTGGRGRPAPGCRWPSTGWPPPGTREACTRRMLLGFQAAGGTLDARLAELAAGRAYNPPAQPPPAAAVFRGRVGPPGQRLPGDHRRVVRGAQERPWPPPAAAGTPAMHGWSGDNLRWLLARTGPVGIVAFGEHLGCSDNVVRQRGGVLEASRGPVPGPGRR